MIAWTKRDVVSIIERMKTESTFTLNDVMFISASKNNDGDSLADEFYSLMRSTGGAAALSINLGEVNSRAIEGSFLAKKMMEGKSVIMSPFPAVVVGEMLFDMGHELLQFVVAHELGHIHHKHYQGENIAEELDADEFALNLLNDATGAVAFFKMILGMIGKSTSATVEIKNKVIRHLRIRAQAVYPTGEYHEEDFQLYQV